MNPTGYGVSRCVFCDGIRLKPAFSRQGRQFVRCSDCRAYVRTQRSFALQEVYESGSYAEYTKGTVGESVDALDEFIPMLRPSGRLLEIGCGTGQILAAAKLRGFDVTGIETSPFHRELIRRVQAIETIAEPLESAKLDPCSFDNIISINVFEHIVEPREHLEAVARVLKPRGRCLISTANADCLIATVCGPYWSMFKPLDHFSIPSPKSLDLCARAAGLLPLRTWCSEYPLETPLGFALALRDWIAEKRGRVNDHQAKRHEGPAGWINSCGRSVMKLRAFRFVAAVFSRMMVAGSLKVLLEKPADSR